MTLPQAGVGAILSEVQRYGRDDLETGGFLLADARNPETVTAIAMAGKKGIERGWGFFQISATAVDVMFAWADSRGLRIPAQFHSHKKGSWLSLTDRRDGFNVRGFISCVVPRFQSPPRTASQWGWWLFRADGWETMAPPDVAAADVQVVIFDEEGVRAGG